MLLLIPKIFVVLVDFLLLCCTLQVGKGKYNGVVDCAKQVYASQVDVLQSICKLFVMVS
jgi:hypothetical protein